jgi:hypothetical protein
MSDSLVESCLKAVFRASSRRASKYMTVPAIIVDARSTPMMTEARRRQWARLRLITRGQALISFGID